LCRIVFLLGPNLWAIINCNRRSIDCQLALTLPMSNLTILQAWCPPTPTNVSSQFPVSQGGFHSSSHTESCRLKQTLALFPSPPDGVFYCYLLEFCPPQVSKCYGCNEMLKPEGRVIQPPFNLVVVAKMNRAYYSNGEKKCKLSNVYFHCRLHCVRQKQPYFLPTMCKIPPKLTPFLLPCHKDVLNNLWVMVIRM